MATKTTSTTSTISTEPKIRKTVELLDRTKTQWSTATLKAKVSVSDIDALVAHLNKLKSLVS